MLNFPLTVDGPLLWFLWIFRKEFLRFELSPLPSEKKEKRFVQRAMLTDKKEARPERRNKREHRKYKLYIILNLNSNGGISVFKPLKTPNNAKIHLIKPSFSMK